jgi:beta-1,4-mannosyltransferase
VVAGSPRDEGVREEVEAAAAGDPRVLLRLDFIADDEVADLHEAADVAVLGYREVFSSGALLLALSLGLPLIAPAEGSTAEIGGPPAIRPFAPGELAAALAAAQAEITAADRDAARAVADRYDWASIAERTLAAYGLTELTPGR